MRAERLRGLTQAQILRAARELRPMPGAREFVSWLQDGASKVVLVTGGPREVAESALALFDADAAFSNEFHYEDGIFTGAVTIHVSPRRKGEIVRELAAKWGIRKEKILAVGDGMMDVPLLTEAGTRLAINSHGKLKEHVDFETSDFHEARRWLVRQGGIRPLGSGGDGLGRVGSRGSPGGSGSSCLTGSESSTRAGRSR